MDIIEIFPPYIYSISYDGENEDEYTRLFQYWHDMAEVTLFMEDNIEYLKSEVWSAHEPEEAARQVLTEAYELEELFAQLYENALKSEKPDYDSFFKYLEGKYKYVTEWVPMKSYGPVRPSLLRIYAIKMSSNTYLITGGGIKLADTIQNSPDLRPYAKRITVTLSSTAKFSPAAIVSEKYSAKRSSINRYEPTSSGVA